MALVTVDELRDYMDIEFSNRQEDAAQLVLDGLQNELEFILRRPVEVGTFTETVLIPEEFSALSIAPYAYGGNGTAGYYSPVVAVPPYTFLLSQSPVISIESVTRQGPHDDAPFDLVHGTDWLHNEFGMYMYTINSADQIVVTYTAGIDGESLPYLKLVMLRAASREVQNLHDDVVGLKELSTRDVAPLEVGFSAAEIATIQRYKRKRI